VQPRIALISTVRHNVGDDFVREGILSLLEDLLGVCVPLTIHKHIPATARPEWEWIYTAGITRVLDRLPRGKGNLLSRAVDLLPFNHRTDRVLSADLLVQCGTPVYYCFRNGYGAHRNEWFGPLVRDRHGRVRGRVPFLNLGAGSCQPYGDDGSEVLRNPLCRAYLQELRTAAALTTVRDTLAREILRRLGHETALLACPSLFARDRAGIRPGKPGFIALNFMPKGGHYDLELNIDTRRWQRDFATFAQSVAQEGDTLLVCHDRAEETAARRILPGIPRFFSEDWRKYLEVYAGASAFVGCRVHGAFAAASFGRPALLVGNDSRALMMDTIAMPRLAVGDASAERLRSALSDLLASAPAIPDRIEALRDETRKAYRNLLRPVLSSAGFRLRQEGDGR
jgi:hypothetical protein